jgi:hypothetical protein
VDLFFPGPIVLKVKENLFYITNDQRAVEVLDLVGGCLEGAVLNYIFKIPLTSDFQEFGKIFDLVCYKGGSCDFGFLPAMIELEESGVNFYGTDLFGFQGFFNKNKEGLQSLNVSKDFKFCLNEISSFNLKESKMQVKVDMSDFQEGKSGKIFVLKEAKKGLGLESNMVDLGSVSNMQTVSKNFCKKLVMSSLFDEVESVKVVISKLPKNEYSELFLNEVRWVEGF